MFVSAGRKELFSNLQLRDALMAKIIFHKIQMEEVTHNLQETKKEVNLRNVSGETAYTYIKDCRNEQRHDERR